MDWTHNLLDAIGFIESYATAFIQSARIALVLAKQKSEPTISDHISLVSSTNCFNGRKKWLLVMALWH